MEEQKFPDMGYVGVKFRSSRGGWGISCVWFQFGLVSIVVRGAKGGRSVYSTMSL